MKTIEEIRFANLMLLREQHRLRLKRDSDAAFARLIDITSTHYGHIKTHRRTMGQDVARRIEHRLELEIGWMDTDHGPWQMLAGRAAPECVASEPSAGEYLAIPPDAYLLPVLDAGLAPRAFPGEYFLIYPSGHCEPGSDVIVSLKSGQQFAKRWVYSHHGHLAFEEINYHGGRVLYPAAEVESIHLIAAIFSFKSVPHQRDAT